MASFYLVATGNWSDPSIWGLTADGAGGASVPSSNDIAVIGDWNTPAYYTVTMDEDVTVQNISGNTAEGPGGKLIVGAHRLTILNQSLLRGMNLDFTDSTIVLKDGLNAAAITPVLGNTTLIYELSDGSTRSLQGSGWSSATLDVIVNLGVNGTNSNTLNVTGSPTFRSLIIQSKNTAAHTVNFDDNAAIITEKFIGIGSSISSRLLIQPTTETGGATIQPASTSSTTYGQFLDIERVYGDAWQDWAGMPKTACYIGSNSIQDGANNWLLQDPPKISTLVDPLTTAPGSNGNWTVSGTVTQVTSGYDGGGYTTSSSGSIISTDTFDLLDSSIIFELKSAIVDFSLESAAKVYSDMSPAGTIDLLYEPLYESDASNYGAGSAPKFVKVSLPASTNKMSIDFSDDGTSWTNKLISPTLTADELVAYRSMRVTSTLFSGSFPTTYNGTLGSINPSLISAPAVSTGAVTSIGTTSATLGGNVTSENGATVTERGVCWSTSANPTTSDSKATTAGTTGAYTVSATSLTANTTYYYRAYAINSEGTGYGSNATFITSPTTTIDGNAVISSTTISSPSLTIGTSLSNSNQASTVSISNLSLTSATNLTVNNMSLSQSISSPSVVLIKGIYPDSMVVGVSEDSLEILLSIDLGINNLSVAVAESSVVLNKTTLMELDNLSLLTTSDNIGLGINTSISIDPMSLSTAIEHGLVNIGYVIPNITSDNIYAIGVIKTGDYDVAINNTDNIYKVVEL